MVISARIGGAEGDRTPDLRIANATLSQLSYGPIARLDRLRSSGADYGERATPCQASLPARAALPHRRFLAVSATCRPPPVTLRSPISLRRSLWSDASPHRSRRHAALALHLATDRPG